MPIKQTKFETDKGKLREKIRMALSDTVSYEDFAEKLLRRGITVKESRGRLSYLTPDRTRPITARKLGDDFDKTAVFAAFVRNAKQARTKTPLVHYAPTIEKPIIRKYGGKKLMKSNLRNEIKSYIVRQGMTMQEVVDLLRDEHGWSDSVSNLSNKLQRESLRYVEAVQLADALGYEIVWQKRR